LLSPSSIVKYVAVFAIVSAATIVLSLRIAALHPSNSGDTTRFKIAGRVVDHVDKNGLYWADGGFILDIMGTAQHDPNNALRILVDHNLRSPGPNDDPGAAMLLMTDVAKNCAQRPQPCNVMHPRYHQVVPNKAWLGQIVTITVKQRTQGDDGIELDGGDTLDTPF
jgi:hypothetical protein